MERIRRRRNRHQLAWLAAILVAGLAVSCGPEETGPAPETPEAAEVEVEPVDTAEEAAQEPEPASEAFAEEPAEEAEEGGGAMGFELTSAVFADGKPIPRYYAGDGSDMSPPLAWTDPPEGTASFALICDDPDAPVGTWVHWVIYGISGDARSLPENVRPALTLDDGTKQGVNDFKRIGYGGPMPPPGKAHRYFFKLYALDAELGLEPGLDEAALENAMDGHVLDEAQLMGTYQR